MGNYTVGSLFAGVGGICQAFKDASCDVLWANELDDNSRKTYKLNHKTTLLTPKNDVTLLSKDDVSDIDILTAGFPCQPFSQAGHGKGFDDERGKLFFEVTRMMEELKPKAYLLENVKTIVTHDRGNSFRRVREAIAETGYSFIPFILNAAEYTEIPQGRERIYIVGFQFEAHYSFPLPTKENNLEVSTPAPLSASFKIPSKSEADRKQVRDFLESATITSSDYYDCPESKIHKTVREDVKDENIVYQFRRWYIRENKSNVCPTLTANMGAGGHNIPIILDGNVPRRLTPKECFNLQGFPPTFQLPTDIPRGHLYKQAGNTVVVPMVTRIAKEMVRVLDENRDR
jgi:DNA (cytosine-5)-methyltransferase 1